MAKIIRTLLWKEWREIRWKAGFAAFILASAVVIGLRTRVAPDIFVLFIVVFIGGFLMPIFIGMGLFAENRADGSLNALLALPVRPRMIYMVKLTVGTLACIIPLAVSLVLFMVIAGEREISFAETIHFHLVMLWFALILLYWMTAFSVTQLSEARAGLIGLAVFAFWLFLAIGESIARQSHFLTSIRLSPLYYIEAVDPDSPRRLGIRFLAFNTGLALVLLAGAAVRFAKLGRKSA